MATFVTWSMRAGKGGGLISDRTGYSPRNAQLYARAARTLADLKYEPFPSLEKAAPELWELPNNVRSIVTGRSEPSETATVLQSSPSARHCSH